MTHQKRFCWLLITTCLLFAACSTLSANGKPAPLIIREQGSFAVGRTVIKTPGTFDPYNFTAPEGQTLNGDHAYVFYQIPENARKFPLVLWHGYGQFSKTWEATPDGREGYQNTFLRRAFGVYVIDQPRRGDAGRSTQPATLTPVTDDQRWFDTFRVGIWPDFIPGVQFSRDSVNRHGGDVTVVHLPEVGIRGNTHFPFADLNNLKIADLMYEFLEKKRLN